MQRRHDPGQRAPVRSAAPNCGAPNKKLQMEIGALASGGGGAQRLNRRATARNLARPQELAQPAAVNVVAISAARLGAASVRRNETHARLNIYIVALMTGRQFGRAKGRAQI